MSWGVLLGLLAFAICICWGMADAQDRHIVKHAELDPPRILHLHRPDGEPVSVVREQIETMTASVTGLPGHTTYIQLLNGLVEVRESVEDIERIWTE